MGTETLTNPTFYTLHAHALEEGMSTADGQDILDVVIQVARPMAGAAGRQCNLCRAITDHHTDRHADFLDVYVHVYTPSDDEDEDNEQRCAPESRIYAYREVVDLAVFVNTPVDGTTRDGAVIAPAKPAPIQG